MVMLSQLLYFDVVDANSNRARLADLSLEVLEEDYPAVKRLFFRWGNEFRYLEWTEVQEFVPMEGEFSVADLENAPSCSITEPGKEVLLKRDILDALILDLRGRRTTRVCDIKLDVEDGLLRLTAADAGIAGMLRRVTRGLLGPVDPDSMFDWKYIEFLRGDPQAVRNGAGYRLRIGRLPAGEIARLADYIPYLHTAELIKLLPDEKAADVLEVMSVERQLQVIEELEEGEAVALLTLMSSDLATDLIGRLHVDTMKRYLSLMPRKQSNRIIELLRYPEAAVGGVMINDFICLPAEMNVGEASRSVREKLRSVDFTSLIFVIDNEDNRRLRGAVPLRTLLISDESQKLEDIMDPYLETLNPFDRAGDAAYKIVGGQLQAMPVIEKEGRLIGAMTIDAAISQLVPPTSDLQTLRVFS